ncbi:hypothetical protein PROFUN_03764 [Planoprotostelium fungivorum]|uniref:Uncharacterized protein n=1 Tax=Planoprotostelium fungivorum TaxID=1890364 RepID=A0A2P6NDN7_9EUKA|nr:hypothetical protein PROFUN_03764 [Planoprotostelium fungivorum]
MRDLDGVERGPCETPGCICVDFVRPLKDAFGKCDYCTHHASQHRAAPVKANTSSQHVVSPQPAVKDAPVKANNSNSSSGGNGASYSDNASNKKSVYTSVNAPNNAYVQTAARAQGPKKTILDDLKNPKIFFRDLTKKKKE